MINCLIVDDEPVARNILKRYCSHLPFLHISGECGNALEAKELLAADKIDLLFLDIHMPVMNGLGFLTTLKNPPQVIFTTAYQEYAVKAFDLAACDYLLKPFSLERFIIAVDKAKEKLMAPEQAAELNLPPPDFFFVKAEGKLFKVRYSDCLYAEAQGNYTRIVTTTATQQTKMSFSALIAELPSALFIRVHRSFVINKAMISHIEGNRVFIGQKEIPIAMNYKEAFFKALGLKTD
jgi:DNA-binding LytR/AlgR family response regulator